jgi:hypothetical protein
MAGFYDTIYSWARRTTSFAEFLVFGPEEGDSKLPVPGEPIYRLKHWPQLRTLKKNADIYRTLSVMSHRPVNKRWILKSSRLSEKQVDSLLQRLVDEGAVEVIDTSRFADAKP